MRFILTSTAIGLAALGAAAASAQTTGAGWTGFYVGGQLGYGWQPSDGDETIGFDRNLDGDFSDAFPNFAPGFCGGSATSRTPASGCTKDGDGTSWRVHAGFDYQLGAGDSGFVVGAVVDYGRTYIYDSVSAFSTTPAAYKIKAKLKNDGSVRGRAGYALSTGTLVYGTGGLAYGKIRNSFSTTNGVNTFTESKSKKDAWGWTYGGGIEQRVGRVSIGALYLFNVLKNHDYSVRASGGLPGGPFTAVNAGGTDFRRGFSKFAYHTVAATVSYRF